MKQSSFMRQNDAFAWYMEDDPELRSTVVGVAWLDHPPNWDDLIARMDRATRLVPSFRQRPVEVPGRLATPRWTTDPHFDITWHMRRVNAPRPKTPETVLHLAEQAAMTGFDRTRPLWEFTVVEGLRDDRAAMVMKMHHSLTDGIGGVQLAAHLFDLTPGRHRVGVLPVAPLGEMLTAAHLVGEAVMEQAGVARDTLVGTLRRAPRATARAARHPVGTLSELGETARSIGRTVRPLPAPLSPIMTGRGPGRAFHMVTVGFDGLKQSASAAGSTLNDAFMAGLTGGLRLYHERHAAGVHDLVVTLPISIRTPDDLPGGNRITLMRLRVPASIVDPVARMHAIGRICRAARAERSLALTDAIAGGLNLVPTAFIASMLKHVDFLASDVPGFTRPIYLCGAHVSGYYAFGPTIGAALNATLFSYDGRCCIGLNVDVDAVPDHDLLVECLHEGFDEVIGRTERGGGRRCRELAGAGTAAPPPPPPPPMTRAAASAGSGARRARTGVPAC
ncbi:MAG TPA: wax ester/triacylglycerol synthase domain-containing protein [Acidimicrobiales bacterium]|nr:wax ester/triacylglycerol synthase domain-containing protein [Acidimicrobiales bacterium]